VEYKQKKKYMKMMTTNITMHAKTHPNPWWGIVDALVIMAVITDNAREDLNHSGRNPEM
jgi:hypothetical protein